MPEIIVTAGSEGDGTAVLMRERVSEDSLASDHYSAQLIERIGWAVLDAAKTEGGHGPESATGTKTQAQR